MNTPLSPGYDDKDLEAAARMIASENPSKSREVWIEQIYTQIRARKQGETLHHQITGGYGYGMQGKGQRPVSTVNAGAAAHYRVAREVLSGKAESQAPGARKYFDAEEQDAVYNQVERGKAALARGEKISERTQTLIDRGYRYNAQGIRDKWTEEGSDIVIEIDGIEFWT